MLQEKTYNKRGFQMTVEGMFYRLRIGFPWFDLPTSLGRWNSVYKTFNEWLKKGYGEHCSKNSWTNSIPYEMYFYGKVPDETLIPNKADMASAMISSELISPNTNNEAAKSI